MSGCRGDDGRPGRNHYNTVGWLMKLRVAFFGFEVFHIELTHHDPAEMLAEVITELSTKTDTEEEGDVRQFGWGAPSHLERAPEDFWVEEKTFGFHGQPPKPQ